MKNSLFAFLCLAVLSGCAGTGQTVVLPSVNEQRAMPLEAMKACPDLTPLKGALPGDLVAKLGEVIPLYKECQGKQKEEADWIKRSK